jgi:TolB-like protein
MTDGSDEATTHHAAHGPGAKLWHALREHATHWVIGGVLIAATGFAPEEWFARTVEQLNLPENVLHLWSTGIDVRTMPIGLGVALVGGVVLWRRARLAPAVAHALSGAASMTTKHAVPPVTEHPLVLPLPDKPSIAVLPFNNLSGDPEQEYFSDGVAEDIMTELSRSRSLFVIARNSSFTYRGRSVDIKQVSRELGVRCVLEGSVRREGERIRIAVQLIEAAMGAHVGAERYDRDQHGIFAIQDEITRAVAGAIGPAVTGAEMQRAMRRPPRSLGAWDPYHQAMWHLARIEAPANATARSLLARS